METKIPFSSTGNFFNNLGYTAATILDPVRRAGGIWMLWDTDQINVLASIISNEVIQATIHKKDYEEWVLPAMYASLNPSSEEDLWDNLKDTASTMDKPWLVAADFNDFVSQDERKSFTPNHNNRSQKFSKQINNCNLMDLGSVGPGLTWTNNRQGLANTMERLDRAMSNDKWRALFPEGTVRTLPRTYSNHSPLVVFSQGKLKLNTDGCSKSDPGQSGYGGLLRDEAGSWIGGYYGYLGNCTSLEAKLWRLYRGLLMKYR
ncbi:hypothetical protein ACSBR2_037900 [Camellia fascicularis]